ELRCIDGWPDLYTGVETVADLQGPRFGDELVYERLIDRSFDDRAAARCALLAGREERGVDQRRRRNIQIGIREHDRGVLAAHFELDAQPAARGLVVQAVTDVARSG